jgi:hypothetical protein
MPTGRVLEGMQMAQFKDGQARVHDEFNSLLSQAKPAQVVKASITVPVVRAD